MRASDDHILTSHAGSLPRPDELIEAWAQAGGGAIDQDAFAERLRAAVADVAASYSASRGCATDPALLLSPALSTRPAVSATPKRSSALTRGRLARRTGHPALAMMSDLSSGGLPLSVQFVGRYFANTVSSGAGMGARDEHRR
jgi:hypothetical protein